MVDALSLLASAALCFWVLILLDRRRAWPSGQILRHDPAAGGPGRAPPPGERWPAVVAIVPARDEAEVLPHTLPALLEQDHPDFRVVLVDDRSSDGTAACAREIAGRSRRLDRLEVVEGAPPPPGWTGKVHALAQGLAAARGRDGTAPEWLLLTDADILHPRDSARALLAKAASGHDLVSVMARLRADNFWERLLIPPFVFFFQLLYPFRRASSPRSRVAAAAGGCILVRRDLLLAAGGFQAIAGDIIDDVALARAVRRAGGRLWLGLDPAISSLRGYGGLGELWRMVSRTAFVQLRHRYDVLAVTVAAILVFLVAPPVLAGVLLVHHPLGAGAALAAWLVPCAMLLPSASHHRVPAVYCLALPAASLLYLLMTVSSAWDHLRGRGPLWRGRRYR